MVLERKIQVPSRVSLRAHLVKAGALVVDWVGHSLRNLLFLINGVFGSVAYVEGLGEVEVLDLVGSLYSSLLAIGTRDLEIRFIFVRVVLGFRLDSALMP